MYTNHLALCELELPSKTWAPNKAGFKPALSDTKLAKFSALTTSATCSHRERMEKKKSVKIQDRYVKTKESNLYYITSYFMALFLNLNSKLNFPYGELR